MLHTYLTRIFHPWRAQDVLGSFGCEGVTAATEQLREIVNLYVVPPENLTSLMEQGMLAEMESEVCVLRAICQQVPPVCLWLFLFG